MERKWKDITIIGMAVIMLWGIKVSASTSDTLEGEIMENSMKAAFGSTYSAPATLQNEGHVDTGSGDFSVQETDLVIAGKNGLDVPVVRRFSSTKTKAGSFIYNPDPEEIIRGIKSNALWYTYEEEGEEKEVLIAQGSKLSAMQADDTFRGYMPQRGGEKYDINGTAYYTSGQLYNREGEVIFTKKQGEPPVELEERNDFDYYFESMFMEDFSVELGIGWELAKPNLVFPDRVYMGKDDYDTANGTFQTETGEVYDVHLEVEHTEDNRKKFYEAYVWDADSEGRGSYVLAFADPEDVRNTVHHEAGNFDYNLTITHKDGKTYYFTSNARYEGIRCLGISNREGNVIVYNADGTITDTYGNVISMQNKQVTVNGEAVLKYELETINDNTLDPYGHYEEDNRYVFRVLKKEGPGDIADTPNVTEYEIRQSFWSSKMFGGDLYTTYVPEKITYPTGVTTEYTYTTVEDYILYPEFNVNDVKGEKEVIAGRKDTEGETVKEEYTYTYFPENKRIGRQRHWYTKNEKTQIKRLSDNQQITQIFDDYDRKTEETVETMNKKVKYTYSGTRRDEPVDVQTVSMGNNHETKVNYNYDIYRNLTFEKNGDSCVVYTYDTEYFNLPLTEAHEKDANTRVLTENTLTEDHRHIAEQRVYEEDKESGEKTLKRIDTYTYTTDGEVASQTTKSPAGEVVASTSYSYEDPTAQNGRLRTVTQTTAGLIDADGNAAADIVHKTKTDIYGNVVYTKDANGNETTYTYDLLGRQTGQTNADGSTASIAYDTQNNTVTVTDGRGVQMKYEYDGWGNQTKTYVKRGGQYALLEEQTYDGINRPEKLIQYWTEEEQYTQTQSYDKLDRIISQKITDKAGATLKHTQYSYSYGEDSNARLTITTTQQTDGKDGYTPAVVKSVSDYRGNEIERRYTSGGQTITEEKTYDYVGNVVTVTDGNGNETAYEYDYANQVVKVTDALGNTAETAYNVLGNVIAATDYLEN